MRPGLLWAAVLAAWIPTAAPRASPLPPFRHGLVRVQADESSETLRIITHTREYCDQLSARAGQLRRQATAPLAEAETLVAEGDRLCAQGQIRPGITRLRRAIVLLRTHVAAEPPRQ